RLAEEPLARWREKVEAEAVRPGRFAEDRDVVLVPAEGADVGLHPPERGLLIEKAVVPRGVRGILGGEAAVGHESERTDAVVHRDDHHPSGDELIAVVRS